MPSWSMKATDILGMLGKKYAAATAYRDVGRVVLPHRDEATIAEFRTAFLRSKGFRFEYREVPARGRLRDPSASRRFSIRSDGGKIVEIHGFECSRESVSLAVASMTGITFGAAHGVLRMLLPGKLEGRSLSEAPSAELLRTYKVDGKTCFVIRLEGWSADEIVVDERFALLRVGHVGPKLSARPMRPTTGIAQSEFTRVLTYEPELFHEEPPDMNMDW